MLYFKRDFFFLSNMKVQVITKHDLLETLLITVKIAYGLESLYILDYLKLQSTRVDHIITVRCITRLCIVLQRYMYT